MPVGPARAAILAAYDDAPALPAPTTDSLDIQPRTAVVPPPTAPVPLSRPGTMATPAAPSGPGNPVASAEAPAGPSAPDAPPISYPFTPRAPLWPTSQP